MPNIIAEHLADAVLQCGTAEKIRRCITAGVETACAAGYEGEIADLFRLLCERLETRLRDASSGDEPIARIARDTACAMAAEAGLRVVSDDAGGVARS